MMPDRAGAQFTFAFARPCAHRRTTLEWRSMRHGGLHLGQHCVDCGRWLRWLRWVPQRRRALVAVLEAARELGARPRRGRPA
jgi:hypothetical protein